MSMEIYGFMGLGQVKGLNPTERLGETQKSNKAEQQGSAPFSSALQNVKSTQSTKGVQDPERVARIQELKAQVASGQYQPDLQKVSSSLLKFLAEM